MRYHYKSIFRSKEVDPSTISFDGKLKPVVKMVKPLRKIVLNELEEKLREGRNHSEELGEKFKLNNDDVEKIQQIA